MSKMTAEEYRRHVSKTVSEDDVHKAVIEWARSQSHRAYDFLMHVPNGGHRKAWVGKKMKEMGTRRGVPDLYLPYPTRGWDQDTPYGGLWLELKSPSGRVRREQAWWLRHLTNLGYATAVAFSFDEATRLLHVYVNAQWEQPDLDDLPEPKEPV